MAPRFDPSALRRPIRCSKDIAALEALPYDEVVPVRSMPELLERSARLFGDRPALTFLPSGGVDDTPDITSYATLFAKVNKAANAFRRFGVGPTDAVAILLPALTETFISLFGAETAGRACPINYMLNAEHIAALIEKAGAKVLVTLGPDKDLPIWDKVEDVRRLAPGIEHVVCVGENNAAPWALSFDALMANAPLAPGSSRHIDPGEIAAFYHTGGTTGAPKLVRQTHGNQVHASWFGGLFYDIGPEDVVINGFPLFHVAGAFVLGGACFAAGANIIIPSKLGMRSRRFVDDFWRVVEKHRITLLSGGPTFVSTILQQDVGDADISRVAALFGGGSPMPLGLASAFEQKLGIPIRSIYGMTEAVGLISVVPRAAERVPGSAGWPLPYSQVRAFKIAVDGKADTGQAATPGSTGALALKGPNISPGYSDPSLNEGSFTNEGWFLTGDLGHVAADGQVFVTGRSKDVIIRGGHNIDPAGIEEALMHQAEVQLCGAVGQPDRYAGELPVAFVQLKRGSERTAEDILAAITASIPERAAIPKHLYLLDAMPLTTTGKVFKPALRRLAAEYGVREQLEALAPPNTRFKLECLDHHAGYSLRVCLQRGPGSDVLAESFREYLSRFVIPSEIVEADVLPAAGAKPFAE